MDLTSGKSIWQAREDAPPEGGSWRAGPLEGDLSCEVAIVGGGISGALAAHELVRRGMHVVLVDRGDFGEQSTAASTGLLMYELDRPLSELIPRVGQESAVAAYRCGLTAVDKIEATAAPNDRCEFSRRSAILIESRPERLRQLEEEFACRRQWGFDVEWLDAKALRDISSIPAAGAIRSTGNGQLNPLAYTRHLLADAARRGLTAFSQTAVSSVLRPGNRIVLVTDRGRIEARNVVYTTGYELGAQLNRRIGDLNCTFAVASARRPHWEGWPDESLLWETGRPYHYARLTPDGRALLGGQDTPFAEDHTSAEIMATKARLLARKFADWFPSCDFRTEYVWAGAFGDSDDGLPFIGALRGREREFAAVGFGGNGITFSAIAAETISQLIRGVPDRNAHIFRLGR